MRSLRVTKMAKINPYRAPSDSLKSGYTYDSLTIHRKQMSEVNVKLKDGATMQMPASITVGEALKKLDRDMAKQALAAKVRGFEVDLPRRLDSIPAPSGPA